MASSDVFSVQGESASSGTEPLSRPEAAAAPAAGTGGLRWPQLIPIAQLIAVILAVFAIIWNQQQTTDSIRAEMRAEIGELRAEVSENGQRLARIEGFLRIGVPDSTPRG